MKTISPNTHIGKIRTEQRSDMSQVCNILGWTPEQYCRYQFKQYCAFVEALSTDWPKIREQILYSPVFRGFWNNEWANRDKYEFLSFAPDNADHSYNLSEYLFIHDHERLLEEDQFMIKYNNILKIL
ncbi:hypothetical protein MM236_19025 [Belliella sp. DSM 107340]|uniref:Uncharacterized protein n=1 Tax=Belliella calami TaxID=2923436 RepID=A0ABS9UTZ0_9BACT|nr:hypothetical protein [Belliella calami]MCH7400096.1 hypothetical protein [Belliella calami]